MEFYQMPMFNKLLVKDIIKAEKWYEKTLGFKSVFKFRNENNEVIMNHLRLNKYQDIMLIQAEDFVTGNGCFINILVEDIKQLSESISEKFIIDALEQKPWNAAEMTVIDLDGYQITLTQSNISNKDFDKLMNQVSKKY